MRKLVLAAALVVMLLATGYAAGSLSQGDLEDGLSSVLADSGFKCTVKVKDFDGDGVLDVGITAMGTPSDKIPTLLGTITGAMGVFAGKIDWKCDKVLLVVSAKKGWHTTAAACQKCYKMSEAGGSDEEIGQCVLDSWTEEDIND